MRWSFAGWLTVQEATLALFWRADARVFTLDAGEVLADDPSERMRVSSCASF